MSISQIEEALYTLETAAFDFGRAVGSLTQLVAARKAAVDGLRELAAERNQLLTGLLKYRRGELWSIEESLAFNGLVSRLEKEQNIITSLEVSK